MDIEFPKKKMTGNKDREFIVMRQNALQHFLNFITSHPILRHSVGIKNFIHPSLYSGNQQGIYLCISKIKSFDIIFKVQLLINFFKYKFFRGSFTKHIHVN